VAKGGLRTLTKTLAKGLGEHGITVNDLDPGFTDTIRDYETHPGATPEASAARAREMIPIKRQPTVDELAWGCVFLCSPRSAAITGVRLTVDGGSSMFG
jgi:NAD(P)-dependent dehydrogenase (short-subunit alcohol dehydrogenase family)